MFLEVAGLFSAFQGETVLSGVDLSVGRGGALCVVGRSGAGKTTLLKTIAGLLSPEAGSIRLDGREITELPAERRGIVYLYQEALLFPHLTVLENIAFGLRLRKTPQAEVARSVGALIDELELQGHEGKMPHQLSGGQRQRVAFGRALIVGPALLLLDEPFSSLDSEARAVMQQLYKRIARQHGMTSIFVTHSIKEALLMGETIASLEGGRARSFASLTEFIAAPESGVAGEVAFWKSLGSGNGG